MKEKFFFLPIKFLRPLTMNNLKNVRILGTRSFILKLPNIKKYMLKIKIKADYWIIRIVNLIITLL